MKIGFSLIMILVLICEASALNSSIIRREDKDKVSYSDTDDNTQVSFDKKTQQYALKVNSIELKEDWVPELAKKTFLKFQSFYQMHEERQRFNELLTPKA